MSLESSLESRADFATGRVDSMTASSDACLAMDDERLAEDDVVVSLTVRELASLLTHADRSFTAAYSPNLMEVVPWNKWLRFVTQLARDRGNIVDEPSPDDVKVGSVFRRRGERWGVKWLVVEVVERGTAVCAVHVLTDGGSIVEEGKRFRTSLETLRAKERTYFLVERVGDHGPVAMKETAR
jgi:hypothetical protein